MMKQKSPSRLHRLLVRSSSAPTARPSRPAAAAASAGREYFHRTAATPASTRAAAFATTAAAFFAATTTAECGRCARGLGGSSDIMGGSLAAALGLSSLLARGGLPTAPPIATGWSADRRGPRRRSPILCQQHRRRRGRRTRRQQRCRRRRSDAASSLRLRVPEPGQFCGFAAEGLSTRTSAMPQSSRMRRSCVSLGCCRAMAASAPPPSTSTATR